MPLGPTIINNKDAYTKCIKCKQLLNNVDIISKLLKTGLEDDICPYCGHPFVLDSSNIDIDENIGNKKDSIIDFSGFVEDVKELNNQIAYLNNNIEIIIDILRNGNWRN